MLVAEAMIRVFLHYDLKVVPLPPDKVADIKLDGAKTASETDEVAALWKL